MEELNFEQTMVMLSLASNEDLEIFKQRMLVSKNNQEQMVEEMLINLMATDVVLEHIEMLKTSRNN